jgi:hypothetical protein
MDRQLHTAGAHAGARGMASGFPLTCNEGAKPYVQYAGLATGTVPGFPDPCATNAGAA